MSEKSEESNHPLGQQLPALAGHVVFPFAVELPLDVRYREETGELLVECPNVAIEGREKVGILHLRFSPEALYSLIRALRVLEKIEGKELGAAPKSTVKQ